MFEHSMTVGRQRATLVAPTWQTDRLARHLLPEIFPVLGGDVDAGREGGMMEVTLPFSGNLSLESYKRKLKHEPGQWHDVVLLLPGFERFSQQMDLCTFAEQAFGWNRKASLFVSPARTSLFCELTRRQITLTQVEQAYDLLDLNWSVPPRPHQKAQLLKEYLGVFLRAAFAAVRELSISS